MSAGEILSVAFSKLENLWLRPWINWLTIGWVKRGPDWLWETLSKLEKRNRRQ